MDVKGTQADVKGAHVDVKGARVDVKGTQANVEGVRAWTQKAPERTRLRRGLTAPHAEGEREYTRSGHLSQKGRENTPVAGANRRRGERLYP